MRYRGGGVSHSFVPIPNYESDPPEKEAPTALDELENNTAQGDEQIRGHITSESEDGSSGSEGEGDIIDQLPEGGNESDEDHVRPEDGEGDLIELEDEAGYGAF